ncbi:hypothetical protein [Legionella pneumophila]|uniref:Uncharacterized protein n=1 Tax=Legionella pneumophila subsp. pascullei TaxID=91890 RepID=A0AAX2IS33_LEGPN|nr:hypothetical protein [Legionella pneumophila]AMP88521.1 hypothetical protein AXF35_01945 [Legionella pneumophila subsp. pascullei]AMP91430.1 hypothetical protein AXF36_01935 [Legionella pneumophila subsp. pascullei]AMP94418.1 hypothetical protein AXF37_01935 [Legionella pneumophila subsp. pascullei]SQG89215.1 Uncharacterised protein [Legionella pneumophila subsp. pascullei]VEH04269.1 Uncharacterised protein [Legionella pneumophila subsp. pascullei]
MNILFLARKLASDYGFIEQIQQSQNRKQMNYRFYTPRPDLNSPYTNSLYGSVSQGVISKNMTFMYWYRDGKNSYVIESTKKIPKKELAVLHQLLMDNQHSLEEILEASNNRELSFQTRHA